ncbi:DsbA family protein [Enterococcus sp. LJL128]|uniref:DsbA family protein n=1 Tax=Enterococcus sp. LJL51 TaxID=3416656 RepID=UPI003CFA4BF3
MDISQIDASKVTEENGLIIGRDSAPVKMIEFMNVRCPYCRQWFNEYDDMLTTYVNNGKLQRIIKLFDKEKESLQRGNMMHRFINYDLPLKGLTDLRQIYATQDKWGDMSLTHVAEFAQNNLGLQEMDNRAVSQAVIDEAVAANIQFVPTIIIDQHIFDESVTKEELIAYIEHRE